MTTTERPNQAAAGGAFHEDVLRTDEVEGPSDRKFGLTITAVCGVFGGIRLALGHGYWLGLLGAALIFAIFAVFWPLALRPLNRAWMKLGLVLHRVVNPVVMTLLFVTTIVPIGLLMRSFGKDPLRLRREPEAATYWIVRDPPGPAADSMRQQF
jgi:hypothetical protein